MDDPKNFRKFFFGSKVSKWSNSKSYHVKSEIWRPSKNFPLLGHQSWRLRKFSKFFEKIFLAEMFPNGPIRKVIMLKVNYEDLQEILSLGGHQSWRLRKLCKMCQKLIDLNLWMIQCSHIQFSFFIMFSISNQITVFIFFLGGPLKFMLV